MTSEVDRMRIERECERLIIESAVLNDRKDWTALAALYTPDGHLERPSGQRIEGRPAIEAVYAAGPPERLTRHACVNLRVHVDGPKQAHATTMVLLYSWNQTDETDAPSGIPVGEGPMIGEFVDTFVPTDEGWRIASRKAQMSMRT